jgi:hypothetical protein
MNPMSDIVRFFPILLLIAGEIIFLGIVIVGVSRGSDLYDKRGTYIMYIGIVLGVITIFTVLWVL